MEDNLTRNKNLIIFRLQYAFYRSQKEGWTTLKSKILNISWGHTFTNFKISLKKVWQLKWLEVDSKQYLHYLNYLTEEKRQKISLHKVTFIK